MSDCVLQKLFPPLLVFLVQLVQILMSNSSKTIVQLATVRNHNKHFTLDYMCDFFVGLSFFFPMLSCLFFFRLAIIQESLYNPLLHSKLPFFFFFSRHAFSQPPPPPAWLFLKIGLLYEESLKLTILSSQHGFCPPVLLSFYNHRVTTPREKTPNPLFCRAGDSVRSEFSLPAVVRNHIKRFTLDYMCDFHFAITSISGTLQFPDQSLY